MVWLRKAIAALCIFVVAGLPAAPQAQQAPADSVLVGPVNAIFPRAGTAIRKDLAAPLASQGEWTLKSWIKLDDGPDGPRTIAVLVDQQGTELVAIGVARARIVAMVGSAPVAAAAKGKVGEWQLVTLASRAGKLALAVGDAKPVQVGAAPSSSAVALVLAPRSAGRAPFGGAVASLALWQGMPEQASRMVWTKPDARLVQFESASPTWPLQVKQQMGMTGPQDQATLPVSRAPARVETAAAKPVLVTPPLTAAGDHRWVVGGWRLAPAAEVTAGPAAIARPGFDASRWLPATVPGTILATYVANGIYPDPAHGLNNLLIPESLSRQDYWLRTEFVRPDSGARGLQAIVFHGINYAAEIWVNGEKLGTTEGAFTRGRFVLPARFGTGERIAVAVRVSPPPHPGLPHEESLTAGPGQNGGAMTIDGPTFSASEGWDWIPTVRDRNTGVWQDVVLEAAGDVRLGDPHVNTVLPLADNSLAELTFAVPVINDSAGERSVEVEARFGDVTLRQNAQVPPRSTATIRFAPEAFAQLRIRNPEL